MKQLLISAIFALAAATGASAQSVYSGRVSDTGGAPLAGVPVSDGFSIVTTDADGLYTITADERAHYLWPITPSGYEPTSTIAGVEHFFLRLEEIADPRQADFTLNAVGNDSRFRFIAIADPWDPWATYLYSYKADDWMSPCDHLFHCDVPATGSVVEVVYADRFGTSRTKSLTLSSVGAIESVGADICGVERTEVYDLNGCKLTEVTGRPVVGTLPLPTAIYVLKMHAADGSVTTAKAAR